MIELFLKLRHHFGFILNSSVLKTYCQSAPCKSKGSSRGKTSRNPQVKEEDREMSIRTGSVSTRSL